MLDLTQTINYRKISNIKKLMREQDVYANCLLEMPVGPMEKNFRQFEENPFIHLNVCMVASDEEKTPVRSFYASSSHSTR